MPRETKRGLYIGVIEQDAEGNFFCGPVLLDYRAVMSGFKIGDRISLKKIIANNSAKSIAQYPQKAIKFAHARETMD